MRTAPGNPDWQRRHGISLLEVLISIFVMTVGLLGLAALIPVGRFEVLEAAKLDRGATLGKQAYREVLLRGMLKPYTILPPFSSPSNPNIEWLAYNASQKQLQDAIIAAPPIPNPGALPAYRFALGSTALQPPFAIDPLMFADPRNYDAVWGSPASGTPTPDTFPYNYQNDAVAAGLQQQRLPRIPRLSLGQLAFKNVTWSQAQQELAFAVADRLFTGHDDLSFVIAGDQDARPIQQYQMLVKDSNGPTTSTDFQQQLVTKRAAPMSVGDFSWLLTVSPAVNETLRFDANGNPVYSAQNMRTLDVSVVVFYKRPITLLPDDGNEPPAERTVSLSFAGSGIGGGSAHLSTDEDHKHYLRNLRPNQWILVTGRLRTDVTTANSGPFIDKAPVVAKWYRIVSVDDGAGIDEPGEPHRDITLDGPDWNTSPMEPGKFKFDDLNPSTNGEWDMAASVFDGVIAVYDRTVTLQSN